MVVTIKKLHLNNWKGSSDEVFEFSPVANSAFAANGTGKTRLPESFTWLLSGKDLLDRKDYDIKNNKRTELNRQDHTVSADFIIDGSEVELKRIYREKWTKKQGNPTPDFTGHESAFFKNSVPFNQSQFQEVIKSIAPENIIKLVTNPLYFNSLKWQDQRAILIQMAGSITDEEVLEHTKKQKIGIDGLVAILNARINLDEHKVGLNAKKKLLSEELKGVPGRIDEVSNQKPKESEEDFKKYEDAIKILNQRDDAIVAAMTELQNKGAEEIKAFYEKQNEISDLRAQANQIFQNKKREYKAAFDNKSSEKRIADENISRVVRSIESDRGLLAYEERKLNGLRTEIQEAKQKFLDIKASEFKFDARKYEGGRACPTCGQALPTAAIDIEEIEKSDLAKFNSDKATQQARAKQIAIDKNEALKPLNDIIDNYISEIKSKEEQVELLKVKASEIESGVMPSDDVIMEEVKAIPEYSSLILKADNMESILPETPKPVDVAEKKQQRSEISEEKAKYQTLLGGREALVKADKRITELEARELELSQLIANIEQEVFAIDSFSSSKMALVENKVNSMFEDVSFKLFSTQVNGAIVDDCVLWFDGKPWASLSTAQEIWAGLCCIKTFSKHYNLYMPIWIDNRESITNIPGMESQVISLYVSPEDKELRIVHS